MNQLPYSKLLNKRCFDGPDNRRDWGCRCVLPAQPAVHYARWRYTLELDIDALHELRVSAELELPLATQLLYSELLREVSIGVT